MVITSTTRFATGIFFAGILLAGPAFGQWRVAKETPAGMGKSINVAMVENESGSSLRLFNDEAQTVRGIFTIRDGFDTIDPEVCPTYRVDNREPMRVTFEEGRCRVLPRQAEFTLGKTGQGRNRQLHRIMNGDSIAIRYRLAGGNYRETTFTLRGSKYALTTVVDNLEVGIDQ